METLETTVRDARDGRASLVLRRRAFTPGWRPRPRRAARTCCSRTRWTQGKVTPLHQHPDADETFYMLEGEVRLHIAGDEQTLAAGGIAIIPRGVPHAFMVTSPTARMLCLQTPGGGEAFYRHASEPAGAGHRRRPTSGGSARQLRPPVRSRSSARRRSEPHPAAGTTDTRRFQSHMHDGSRAVVEVPAARLTSCSSTSTSSSGSSTTGR